MIVEPVGSILNGGEPHAHKTEGIGMEFIPDYMDKSHFDEIYTVTDENAFRLVKEAAEKEGLLIGSSSGAALYAALEEAKKYPLELTLSQYFLTAAIDISANKYTKEASDMKKKH